MEGVAIFDSKRIIPSVVRYEQIAFVEDLKCERVNLMIGTINNLNDIVKGLQAKGKKIFVHIDMIGGIGKDSEAVKFFSGSIRTDGIITTKSSVISACRACGLLCVQRIFAIDTAALKMAVKTVKSSQPDEVELMPGLMPRIVSKVKSLIDKPLIVGGLIDTPEEIKEAFGSGADYVSVGNERLWY